MNRESSLEQSYLALVEFLLLAKQRLLELGTEHGMSGMQVITLLLSDTPRPMNSFKHLFNCDASNVTGIVDGLQQKKLVARYENPRDRRVKMVKLLAEGKRLRTTLLRQLTASDEYLLAKLTPNEAAAFIELVQKITRV
jgi:DNA-binding MarR family transcriptional regulator